MDKLDAKAFEIARNLNTDLLQEISKLGQNQIAPAIDTSESTLSRVVPQLEKTILLMRACGYKVVPMDLRCYRDEDIEPLLTLAKQRMAQLETVRQLEWED